MRNAEFRRLLASLERLTPRQWMSLRAAVEPAQLDPEAQLPAPDACPRCGAEQVIRWGRARGRQRWRCKYCNRTFSRFTNTPREGLRYRERWAEFAGALLDGATVNEIAERCGVSTSTAHRWRSGPGGRARAAGGDCRGRRDVLAPFGERPARGAAGVRAPSATPRRHGQTPWPQPRAGSDPHGAGSFGSCCFAGDGSF